MWAPLTAWSPSTTRASYGGRSRAVTNPAARGLAHSAPPPVSTSARYPPHRRWSAGGNIVVGSDGGYIFTLHQRNDEIECVWMFRPGDAGPNFAVQSSPVLQLDPRDLSLLSVFIGGSNGQLLALNGIGTSRWAFPSTGVAGGPVSSSPASDVFGNLYITTPEGASHLGRFRRPPELDVSDRRTARATVAPLTGGGRQCLRHRSGWEPVCAIPERHPQVGVYARGGDQRLACISQSNVRSGGRPGGGHHCVHRRRQTARCTACVT